MTGSSTKLSEANILRLPALSLGFLENCECRANSVAFHNYDLLASPQRWALHGGHGLERPLLNSQLPSMASYKQIFRNFLALGIPWHFKIPEISPFLETPRPGKDTLPLCSSGGATTSQWPILSRNVLPNSTCTSITLTALIVGTKRPIL